MRTRPASRNAPYCVLHISQDTPVSLVLFIFSHTFGRSLNFIPVVPRGHY